MNFISREEVLAVFDKRYPNDWLLTVREEIEALPTFPAPDDPPTGVMSYHPHNKLFNPKSPE